MADISGMSKGFWGETDALIDWCEANYVISYFIAEFYNTISSLPITVLAIVGIICTLWNNQLKEMRFIVTFINLGLVGLGSAAFHMTLRYYGQLFDELPMLLGSLSLLYCIVMTESTPNTSNHIIALLFISWGIFQIYVYIVYKWYIVFLLSYGGQTLVNIIFAFKNCRKLSSRLATVLYLWSVCIYGCGLALWFMDQRWCNQLQSYQLHAIWHLFAGYASYLSVWTAMVLRGKFLNRIAKLKSIKLFGAIPVMHYLVVEKGKYDL
eukprot:266094_1